MNSKVLLVTLIFICLAAAFFYWSSRPRYRMLHAEDGYVYRLDTVTGDLAVCGPTGKPPRLLCNAVDERP